MRFLIQKLWNAEDGQDLVEYALLLTFLTLVAIASIKNVGATLSAMFQNANSSLSSGT
jgi:Flp pilus assembly pilin Flp